MLRPRRQGGNQPRRTLRRLARGWPWPASPALARQSGGRAGTQTGSAPGVFPPQASEVSGQQPSAGSHGPQQRSLLPVSSMANAPISTTRCQTGRMSLRHGRGLGAAPKAFSLNHGTPSQQGPHLEPGWPANEVAPTPSSLTGAARRVALGLQLQAPGHHASPKPGWPRRARPWQQLNPHSGSRLPQG